MLHLDALQNKNQHQSGGFGGGGAPIERGAGEAVQTRGQSALQHGHADFGQPAGRRPPAAHIAVTIQKELADRIVARPGKKDYGALSIWVQSQCQVEILRALAARGVLAAAEGLFGLHPIHAGRRPCRGRIPDREFFHDFLRALFCTAASSCGRNSSTSANGKLDNTQVDAILDDLGLPSLIRAERLDVFKRCWPYVRPWRG